MYIITIGKLLIYTINSVHNPPNSKFSQVSEVPYTTNFCNIFFQKFISKDL